MGARREREGRIFKIELRDGCGWRHGRRFPTRYRDRNRDRDRTLVLPSPTFSIPMPIPIPIPTRAARVGRAGFSSFRVGSGRDDADGFPLGIGIAIGIGIEPDSSLPNLFDSDTDPDSS
jgi:hypothetical protein